MRACVTNQIDFRLGSLKLGVSDFLMSPLTFLCVHVNTLEANLVAVRTCRVSPCNSSVCKLSSLCLLRAVNNLIEAHCYAL